MATVQSGEEDAPLDPAAAKLVGRVKTMMTISAFVTVFAVLVIMGVIGYRVFRSEGSAPPGDVTAMLPQGARIVATAVAGDRIAVTLDIAGATEIYTFDVHTLKPTGRLRFVIAP